MEWKLTTSREESVTNEREQGIAVLRTCTADIGGNMADEIQSLNEKIVDADHLGQDELDTVSGGSCTTFTGTCGDFSGGCGTFKSLVAQ